MIDLNAQEAERDGFFRKAGDVLAELGLRELKIENAGHGVDMGRVAETLATVGGDKPLHVETLGCTDNGAVPVSDGNRANHDGNAVAAAVAEVEHGFSGLPVTHSAGERAAGT